MNVTPCHTPAPSDTTIFEHQPLDHSKSSIRLVRLIPSRSPDGYIQCTITHTTIDAAYTCLSYCWGDPNPSHDILIDGKTFAVGHNLFGFLMAAFEKAATDDPATLGPYWIDAICIHQSNVHERNHQVRQMGTIYSRAVQVYVWLGPTVPELLNVLPLIDEKMNIRDEWFNVNKWPAVNNSRDSLYQHVINNVYWTRAWIIQEVVLAQEVKLWLGTASIRLKNMYHWLLLSDGHTAAMRSNPFVRLVRTRQGGLEKHKSLVGLIAAFGDKQCSDPRDRIFSLLSLVTGNGKDLKIDYHISQAELAAEVLRQCEIHLCVCTATLVAKTLNLTGVDLDDPCLEFCVRDIRMSNRRLNVPPICHSVIWPRHKLDSYSIYPDDTGRLHRRLLPVSIKGWENIRFARIPLRELASKEWDTEGMCVYAGGESKGSHQPPGYPRICYASDRIEHPVLAKSSARLKIQMDHSPEMTQSNGHERKRRTLQITIVGSEKTRFERHPNEEKESSGEDDSDNVITSHATTEPCKATMTHLPRRIQRKNGRRFSRSDRVYQLDPHVVSRFPCNILWEPTMHTTKESMDLSIMKGAL